MTADPRILAGLSLRIERHELLRDGCLQNLHSLLRPIMSDSAAGGSSTKEAASRETSTRGRSANRVLCQRPAVRRDDRLAKNIGER